MADKNPASENLNQLGMTRTPRNPAKIITVGPAMTPIQTIERITKQFTWTAIEPFIK
jgi:hypothetical protein